MVIKPIIINFLYQNPIETKRIILVQNQVRVMVFLTEIYVFKAMPQALMTLHKVMENFEFDWEGLLADHIGDLSAAALARLLRAQWSWSKEFATNARMQMVHHLQADSQLLPSKIEFDHFVDEMERFGTLIDRAEAKLRILEKRS